MKHLIVGTAGHIDHGKTELIRALTGVDTDRLKEEKERGITIDLGFAEYPLSPEIKLGVVDVPGHEGFIRNMLAGVSGIDLVLMVVAADEGVMPQTREHLDILNLLRTKKGIIVVTKADLVDEDWIELIKDDIKGLVADSFLSDAPIINVSTVTGQGLDQLKEAISKVAKDTPEKQEDPLFRLPIDRVFTIKGVGTVVTGTVWSGNIKLDDKVRILPAGLEARIKNIEVHSENIEKSVAGARTALALTGAEISKESMTRGDNVVMSPLWDPTIIVDASFTLLKGEKKELKNRARIRFHLGTSEVMGRVVLYDGKVLPPGRSACVQFRLEEPVIARAGDRFVLRSYSPVRTIGGGEILNPFSKKNTRPLESYLKLLKKLETGIPAEAILSLVSFSSVRGVKIESLTLLTKYARKTIQNVLNKHIGDGKIKRIGDTLITLEAIEFLKGVMVKYLKDQHEQNPLRLGISNEELRNMIIGRGTTEAVTEYLLNLLENEGEIEAKAGKIKLRSHTMKLSVDEEELIEHIECLIEKAGYSPPTLSELEKTFCSKKEKILPLLKILVDKKELVQISSDVFFPQKIMESVREKLKGLISSKGSVGVSEIKQEIPTSRKYMIPLLEYLDKEGFTKRVGDKRVLKEK